MGERKNTVGATVPTPLVPVREGKGHQQARTRLLSPVGSKGGLPFKHGRKGEEEESGGDLKGLMWVGVLLRVFKFVRNYFSGLIVR